MSEGSTASGDGSARDAAGALDALLQAERDIAESLASASEEGARIVEDARAEAQRRRDAAVTARRLAIEALDRRLREESAAAIAAERARAAATCQRFDDATTEQIERLARRALADLFEFEPTT